MGKINRLIPLLILVVMSVMFILYNENLNRKFVNKKVESIVVKRSNWQLRTTEFYLQNGLRIDSTYKNKFDLKIGDSISKKSNTRRFKVFIKNNSGKYQLLYNFMAT